MDINAARDIVARYQLPLAGEVMINPVVSGGIFVPIYVSRDENGRQHPSGRTLAQLRQALEEFDFSPEFLMIDQEAQKIEEGLRSSLISSFPEIVRNSYLTVSGGIANVWIEKKREIAEDERARLTDHARTYAQLFQLRGARLNVTSDFDLATPTEVLRTVRHLAPASCEGVQKALEEQGFSVPSLEWVNHRFDGLRKAGLLVRMPDRTYALTREALHKLGTVKNRRSPDVARLLALARRGG